MVKRLEEYKFVKTQKEPLKMLMPQFYRFAYLEVEGEEMLVMADTHGFVPSREDMEAVILGLQGFLQHITAEEIKELNDLKWEEHFGKKETSAPVKKERVAEQGFVYFMEDDIGRVKIGRTKDLSARAGEYTKLPCEPKFISLIKTEDSALTEKLFHEKFAAQRLRGEWFVLTEKDKADIIGGRYSEEIQESIGNAE